MTGQSHSSARGTSDISAATRPWNSGIVSRELVRVLAEQHVVPCRAVELGCGAGTNAVHLTQQGFEVLGTDCSAIAIERARTRRRSWRFGAFDRRGFVSSGGSPRDVRRSRCDVRTRVLVLV